VWASHHPGIPVVSPLLHFYVNILKIPERLRGPEDPELANSTATEGFWDSVFGSNWVAAGKSSIYPKFEN
jgi:hypothetical protein